MEKRFVCREPLAEVQNRLEKVLLRLEVKQHTSSDQVFFDNQEFHTIMNVSKRTAQKWRETGIIAYSQVGSKIYYRLSDILKMLDSFFNPVKSKQNGEGDTFYRL